jgi:hypothetical protein
MVAAAGRSQQAAHVSPQEARMSDLWTDIDQDVLGALQDKGAVEVGIKLVELAS